jgi:hypothetical protein
MIHGLKSCADSPSTASLCHLFNRVSPLGRTHWSWTTAPAYATAIRQGRYEPWARKRDKVFKGQDRQGTPAAFLEGQHVACEVQYDPQTLGELVRR